MNEAWILQTSEINRLFSRATWIPLRASINDETGNSRQIGYRSQVFACGSVGVPKQHREFAERLSWNDIGIVRSIAPHAYADGHYSPIDEYQYNDKQAIGINLVFEHPQPVVGGCQWILNPDLVIALRLIKEGNKWVRPEENFVEVAREQFDNNGNHCQIEIKREFLIDYLAARGLSLRLSYYRQHVENVTELHSSPYANLTEIEDQREGGRYQLRIKELNSIFGGDWTAIRVWRTDVDEEEDAPVMGPETDENTDSEIFKGIQKDYVGVRVEGEFWRDEWIEHQEKSTRVRGDLDLNLPHFIVNTDGSRQFSAELNEEDIGRWLWFRPSVINVLLSHRGISLRWYTSQTGAIKSNAGSLIHFGINAADFINVYAADIARLPAWEQHIWAAHNIAPDGKVSSELMDSQVKATPADTNAPENLFLEHMRRLEANFQMTFSQPLFLNDIDDATSVHKISRFRSTDLASLLTLSKELSRLFTDRLNVKSLRNIAFIPEKPGAQSLKLLEHLLEKKTGKIKAQNVFSPIFGAYDMRLGDAHPTSSSIGDALQRVRIDPAASYLRQGEQLLQSFADAIFTIDKLLFQY